jgi:hypothetical protein
MNYYSLTKLMEFVLPGLAAAQAMYVAAKLGLVDFLAARSMTTDQLALATHSNARSLRRLLDVLETIGLVWCDEYGYFRNTASGDWFRSDHPASLRPGVLSSLSPLFWRPLGELEESIRTGRPSFDGIFGSSFFDYLRLHPDDAELFGAWMNASNVMGIPSLLAAWDFSRYSTIVDVGGGRGALLEGILSAYPSIRGVLFDQAEVIEGAKSLRKWEVVGRCQIVGGSFFDWVPSHGDAYILRAIIHDWDDERSLAILRNCRRAMQPGSTLLLIETPRDKSGMVEFLDLHMLVQTGGRERTLEEHRELLQQTGFQPRRVARTAGPVVIEGIAV